MSRDDLHPIPIQPRCPECGGRTDEVLNLSTLRWDYVCPRCTADDDGPAPDLVDLIGKDLP